MPLRPDRTARLLPALLAAWLCLAPAAAEERAPAVELTVYTTAEQEHLRLYKDAFEKANPGIHIRWVRNASGVLTDRLLAERETGGADAVWGLAATSLIRLGREGLLLPYAPAGLEAIDPRFRDTADTPAWIGTNIWSSVVCLNRAAHPGVPAPTAWRDLADPAFRGLVSMPNPLSSGTGYLMVAGWIQMMGEEEAWRFMDALDLNVETYAISASKPCRMAAVGRVAAGLSFEYRAAQLKAEGAPIDILLPAEGLGWDMEAAAVLRWTDAPEAARRLMDFAASEAANRLYATNYAIVAHTGVTPSLEFLPPGLKDRLLAQDIAWASDNRERILAEWRRRYGAKVEEP